MAEERLSLKPVEKQLKEILEELKEQAKRSKLTTAQKRVLEADIKNVSNLITSLPSSCHKSSLYDLGI